MAFAPVAFEPYLGPKKKERERETERERQRERERERDIYIYIVYIYSIYVCVCVCLIEQGVAQVNQIHHSLANFPIIKTCFTVYRTV